MYQWNSSITADLPWVVMEVGTNHGPLLYARMPMRPASPMAATLLLRAVQAWCGNPLDVAVSAEILSDASLDASLFGPLNERCERDVRIIPGDLATPRRPRIVHGGAR